MIELLCNTFLTLFSIFVDNNIQTARLFRTAEKKDENKEFGCINGKIFVQKLTEIFSLKNKPCKCLLMALVCFLLNDYESKEKCKKKKKMRDLNLISKTNIRQYFWSYVFINSGIHEYEYMKQIFQLRVKD